MIAAFYFKFKKKKELGKKVLFEQWVGLAYA